MAGDTEEDASSGTGAAREGPQEPAAVPPSAPEPASTGHGRLAVWVAAGAVLGFAAGIWIGPPMVHVTVFGELFLLALRTAVAPLVFVSLVSGIVDLAGGGAARAARVLAVYAVTTMFLAVLLGIFLVTTIGPGTGGGFQPEQLPERIQLRAEAGVWPAIQDMLRSLVSPNALGAIADDVPQMLAVIVFAIGFGLAAVAVGERSRPVMGVIRGLDAIFQKALQWVIWTAPIGVFALVAARLGKLGGGDAAMAEVSKLGLYIVTVIAGLLIHGGIVLPAVLRIFGGRRPFAFLRGMLPAVVTAFSTASSNATMPVTFQCLERVNRVRPAAVRFVVPLGATLNMNGTALYEAVAAIFIAQVYGHDLSAVQLALVAVTATLAAIGASGIPEAGLVTMVIVLQTVGLPLEGIGLLLAVDWFLDRCRTAVNVWDDGVGAAVVERMAHLGDDPSAGTPGKAPRGAG